jgi:hypothetical protein
MKSAYPIHDLYIRKVDSIEKDGSTSTPLLSFDDHLLRRFGFAESISFEPGYQSEMKVREVADEIWICIHGKVQFRWWDLRQNSPTHKAKYKLVIDGPTLVLAPFGVAFGVQTFTESAHLIRFSTHPEGSHEGDDVLPWERD